MFSDLEKTGATPREPMFRVELVPVSKDPLAFARPDWEQLDAQRKLVLPDVGPGTYRLRVYDWLGLATRQRASVRPGSGRAARRSRRRARRAGRRLYHGQDPCAKGRLRATRGGDRRGEGKPYSVATGGAATTTATSASATCRRVPTHCSLTTRSRAFCRLDDVEVPPGVVDVGERTLSAGATISGAIQFVRPSRVPDEVRGGRPIGRLGAQAFAVYSSFDRVELAGLWPGHWTVSARSGDEVLAIGEVDVEGTGTFHGDPDDGRRPEAVTRASPSPICDRKPATRHSTARTTRPVAGSDRRDRAADLVQERAGAVLLAPAVNVVPVDPIALHGDHVLDIVPILGPVSQQPPSGAW